jgi:hypothetical protein
MIDAAQQRTFAGAGSADQDHALASLNFKGSVDQRGD